MWCLLGRLQLRRGPGRLSQGPPLLRGFLESVAVLSAFYPLWHRGAPLWHPGPPSGLRRGSLWHPGSPPWLFRGPLWLCRGGLCLCRGAPWLPRGALWLWAHRPRKGWRSPRASCSFLGGHRMCRFRGPRFYRGILLVLRGPRRHGGLGERPPLLRWFLRFVSVLSPFRRGPLWFGSGPLWFGWGPRRFYWRDGGFDGGPQEICWSALDFRGGPMGFGWVPRRFCWRRGWLLG